MENTLLNLIPAAYLPEIHLSQYDVGRTITFTLKDGASDYSVPSGASVKVKATKPSGFGFEVACTFNGGTVTLVTTDTMTPENGRFPAELSIVSGNTTIGTSNFIFNIERSPHPEGTIDGDAETIIPELTLLVERIEAAADSVDEDTQIVTEAKAEVLQAKADTLQAKADTLQAKADTEQLKADTLTAKESAEASAQAAAESVQEAEDTLSEYAKVDGYYEEMAVGNAEQLLSTQFVEDSVPYKFRTSGGSKDIGNREYDEIVGGSIVWNQLSKAMVETNWFADNGGTRTISNGVGTLTAGSLRYSLLNMVLLDSPMPAGHKLLLSFECNPSKNADVFMYFNNGNWQNGVGSINYEANTWTRKSGIINTVKNSGSNNGRFTLQNNTADFSGMSIQFRNAVAFDLTAMFGSQVADYIYSLETAQSGKGVAFFKSLFPNDYYPYNAGELMSVEGLQSHDTVGFNQWDEETESGTLDSSTGAEASNNGLRAKNYTRCVPNTSYHFTNTGTDVFCILCFYDASKNFISSLTNIHQGSNFTTPNNAQYFRFAIVPAYGATYKNDICINLSWSGWRNGEYEPYKKHSYALDSSLTLRGIPKLNASNELYFDGDIYSHDGKVTRRYGMVDLGTLNWTSGSDSVNTVFFASVSGLKFVDDLTVVNAMAVGFTPITKTAWSGTDINRNKVFRSDNSEAKLYFRDLAYTTSSAFKTAMNGVKLIYELATPTEETAEPYTSPQAVDDFGTEEYISGNVVPVGHNTQYPANLRDKLQHLPNLADNDGYYMISQQNKQMSLEVFRIPKAPTTDGTYTLKATVSGGTPTYIWEAVE